jgi:hypothetical protein
VSPLTTQAAPPPTTAGYLSWNGDFSTGTLSQYATQSCQNGYGMIGSVANPHPDAQYSGLFAASYAISDLATHTNCAILGSPGHPSGNLIAMADQLYPGADFYLGFAVYLPSTFPQHVCWDDSGHFVTGCWMQLMEIYGMPFGGPSPMNLTILGSNASPHTDQFVLGGTANAVAAGSPGAIWRSPQLSTLGTGWADFVIHYHLSTCGGTTTCPTGQAPGFAELWYNGTQQQFFDGSSRVYYPTLNRSNYCTPGTATRCGYDVLYMQQYRGQYPYYSTGTTSTTGTYSPTYPNNGTVTDYLADTHIGASYTAVAPH